MQTSSAQRSPSLLARLATRVAVRALLLLRRPERARARLARHLRDDPSDFRAHLDLALLAFRAGGREEGLRHLEACRDLSPARLRREQPDGYLLLTAVGGASGAGGRSAGAPHRSPREARRLEALPPLTPEEIARVDLDALARRLADEAPSGSPRDGE